MDWTVKFTPFGIGVAPRKHIEARPHIKAVHPVQRLHVLDLRSKQTAVVSSSDIADSPFI